MTRLQTFMTCAIAALTLAACDAVKVPGINPLGDDDETAAPADDIAAPDTPAPGDDVAAPTPPAGGDTTGLAGGDIAGGDTATPPTGPASAPSLGSGVAPTPVRLPVSSLGAINAVRCGLPDTAEPTPTVSALAQARTGPQPESLLTVQAVGAMTVQSLVPFPGIVKMEPRRFEGNAIASGHCAATRIAERWFMTAAHCVDDNYDEIQFIAGTPNLRDLGSARVFTAETSICHSGYAGYDTNFLNDIALIGVPEEALPALTEVPIAEFGVTDRPLGDYHYGTADMAGWGMTGFNQPLSQLLLSAELNIVSASPSVIVISSRNGSGPCIGDSGGPLYITEDDGQRTVVGVLSVVEQQAGQNLCEGEYRGRYTNVQGYRGWIDEVMGVCANQPELCQRQARQPVDSASDGSASDISASEVLDPATEFLEELLPADE